MYELVLYKQFSKKSKKLIDKDESLRKSFIKITRILKEDPFYPSLRLHKLGGTDYYSISVNMQIRILIKFDGNSIFLMDIGSHDDVY